MKSDPTKRHIVAKFITRLKKQVLWFALWRHSNPKGDVPAKSNAILKSKRTLIACHCDRLPFGLPLGDAPDYYALPATTANTSLSESYTEPATSENKAFTVNP
jgi:hypothetical protein